MKHMWDAGDMGDVESHIIRYIEYLSGETVSLDEARKLAANPMVSGSHLYGVSREGNAVTKSLLSEAGEPFRMVYVYEQVDVDHIKWSVWRD